MSNFLYLTFRNALLFYFIVTVFSGGIRIAGGSNLLLNIIAGLIFGALMASIPAMLKFFKLPVTNASFLLMCLVVTFIFYFLLFSGFLGLGSIAPTTINFGFAGAVVVLVGQVQTMVAATIATALGVVGMEALSGKKR